MFMTSAGHEMGTSWCLVLLTTLLSCGTLTKVCLDLHIYICRYANESTIIVFYCMGFVFIVLYFCICTFRPETVHLK